MMMCLRHYDARAAIRSRAARSSNFNNLGGLKIVRHYFGALLVFSIIFFFFFFNLNLEGSKLELQNFEHPRKTYIRLN